MEELRRSPGVETVAPLSQPFPLAGSEINPARTVVEVGGARIGGDEVVVIAGPCAVESRRQLFETARAVKAAGASMLRGGAYKPRTSPYDFQGLGVEALKLLREASRETGLPVVTEVLATEDVEAVAEHADMLQVGARNMQNFALLRALARTPRPVLLKRGPSATIREWLLAAEYLLSGGNPQVVLCERGIKGFETETRNTLDLAAVARARGSRTCPSSLTRRTGRAAAASSRRLRGPRSPSAPTASSSKSTPTRSARSRTGRSRSRRTASRS